MDRTNHPARAAASEAAEVAEHAHHLFRLTPDLLGACGYDGVLRFHNEAWETALGYTAAELAARPYTAIVHPDDLDRTRAMAARLAAGEHVVDHECRMVRADHVVRRYAWSASPAADLIYIVGRDVTEREARERDAREFAHVVSHDLSEPLRAVNGYLELLERDAGGRLDSAALRWLHEAADGAARLRRLIDEVLRYSVVAASDARFERVDLDMVARDVVLLLGPAIDEAGVALDVGALPIVRGQHTPLAQLLQNLIVNAVKFGSQHIDVHATRTAEGWVITVADDGPGIAEADRERIFAMFARAVTDDGPGGSGIGLALCRRIAERHGGRLWVESELGTGATFHVLLQDAADVAVG